MFSFTQYIVVLSNEGKWRTAAFCLDTDLCNRLKSCRICTVNPYFSECLMALGIASFSTSLLYALVIP